MKLYRQKQKEEEEVKEDQGEDHLQHQLHQQDLYYLQIKQLKLYPHYHFVLFQVKDQEVHLLQVVINEKKNILKLY